AGAGRVVRDEVGLGQFGARDRDRALGRGRSGQAGRDSTLRRPVTGRVDGGRTSDGYHRDNRREHDQPAFPVHEPLLSSTDNNDETGTEAAAWTAMEVTPL